MSYKFVERLLLARTQKGELLLTGLKSPVFARSQKGGTQKGDSPVFARASLRLGQSPFCWMDDYEHDFDCEEIWQGVGEST